MIHEKIKNVRLLRNYTQQHLADMLNISKQSYGKIESGETDVAYSRIEEIAKALGVSPEFLASFDAKNLLNIHNSNTGDGLITGVLISGQYDTAQITMYLQEINKLKSEIEFLKKENALQIDRIKDLEEIIILLKSQKS
jgi:transcriptional regulator with XRE-family HTH domain